MTIRTIVNTIIFFAGFATCWFCKEPLLRIVIRADALIKSLATRLALRRKP